VVEIKYHNNKNTMQKHLNYLLCYVHVYAFAYIVPSVCTFNWLLLKAVWGKRITSFIKMTETHLVP